MLTQTKKAWSILAITAMVAAGSMFVNAAPQKAAVPKPQDKLALGEEEVKKLVVIMAPDGSGTVSKQEYMKFMEAEFQRLDKEKKGELDVKNFAQPTVTASRYLGK